jgi:Protein of unknown function (DUF4230)
MRITISNTIHSRHPAARDRGRCLRSRRLNKDLYIRVCMPRHRAICGPPNYLKLKSQAITMNANRTTVTVALPKAQLEPAALNVAQSYVYAQQQGLFDRIGNFFAGNPNSQQQVYILAQQKIQTAAQQSPLLTEAQKNAEGMLDGMLTSLGFQHVTVTFGRLR